MSGWGHTEISEDDISAHWFALPLPDDSTEPGPYSPGAGHTIVRETPTPFLHPRLGVFAPNGGDDNSLTGRMLTFLLACTFLGAAVGLVVAAFR